MHTRRHRGSRKIHRRRTRGRNTRMHRRHKGGFIEKILGEKIMSNERFKDGLSRVKRLSKVGSAIPGIIKKASEPHPKIQIADTQKELESETKKLAQLTTKENERRKQANKDIYKEKAFITKLRSKIADLQSQVTSSQSTTK
jgi:peptidoglycan hydrolase CwlO-like protein